MVLNISTSDGPKVYIAHFTHQDALPGLPWHKRTICTVHEAPCKKQTRPCETTPASQGIATLLDEVAYDGVRCSHLDNFNKLVGHKLAFERAIAHHIRSDRAQLWSEFWRNTLNVKEEVAA